MSWQALVALAVALHLDSNSVNRSTRLVQDASGRLGRHLHDEAALTVPSPDSFHHVSVGRHFCPIRRHIMDRSAYLIEHENGWPAMVVDRLFIKVLERHFENSQIVILKKYPVMAGRSHYRIKRWIPICRIR